MNRLPTKRPNFRLLLAGACCLSSVLSAQAPSGRPQLSFSLSGLHSGDLAMEHGDAALPKMNSSSASLELGYRQSMGTLGLFGLGLAYKGIHYGTEGDAALALPEDLRSFQVNLSDRFRISERWSGMVALAPTWRTTGNNLFAGDAFGLQGLVLFTQQRSETFSWSVGVAADTAAESGENVLPVFALDWQFADRWSLSLGMPRTGVFFAPNEQWVIGLAIDADRGTYHLDSLHGLGGALLPTGENKIELFETRLSVHTDWQFSSAGRLVLDLGMVAYRRLEYLHTGFKAASEDATAPYVSALVEFRY